jgi:Na+/proline symporter
MILFFIGLFFLALLAIGALTWKGSGSLKSFAVADKTLSFPLLTATIVAMFYGSSAIIGGVSLAYQLGLGVLWFMVPFYLGNLALILFLKKIKDSDAYTLPDFLKGFYGSRVAATAALLLAVLCLVPESIIGAGKILLLFSPLSLELSMVLITSVVVVYTLMGGMRSVVYSDFLQFFLMVAAMFVIVPFAVGYNPFFMQVLPPESYNPFAIISIQEILVWCTLLFFLPITSSPLYQRIFASSKGVSIKKVLILSVLIWALIDLTIIISGMVASASFSLDDPDMALLKLGEKVLPYGLQILFFIGLLAAIMSTADSFLHGGATSLAYDFFGGLRRLSERRLLLLSRLCVALLGIISLIIALAFREIIPALIFLLTVWISGILIPTMAALLGYKLRERAALGCMVLGALSSTIWKAFPLAGVDPLFVGLGVSIVAALVLK